MSEMFPYMLLPLHCPECGKEYFTLGEQQEHHIAAHERPLEIDQDALMARTFGTQDAANPEEFDELLGRVIGNLHRWAADRNK